MLEGFPNLLIGKLRHLLSSLPFFSVSIVALFFLLCPTFGKEACFEEASELSGLPEELLTAIAKVESSMHPFAVSIQTDRRIDGILKKLGVKYRRKRGFKAKYLYSLYPKREQVSVLKGILKYAKEYSLGLMQISSTNGRLLRSLGIRDDLLLLLDPCLNIKVGTLVLLECMRIFGDIERSLTCYRAGVKTARRKVLFSYVRKVLREAGMLLSKRKEPKITVITD